MSDRNEWDEMALALRIRASNIDVADDAPDERKDDAELFRVLARLLEGRAADAAFGAPGRWGYHTPIGSALAAVHRRREKR